MAVKYFLLNPEKKSLSKDEIQQIESNKTGLSETIWSAREQKAKEVFEEECTLKHTFGRIIVKANLQSKNEHSFSDGTKIRLERQFNNFNRRETQPVNAIVISADNIPTGSEILIGHNALHDSNKIFSYKSKSPDIQYFSLPEYDCFAWRNSEGKLQPMSNFEFGLRVFKPYEGNIAGIKPMQIKNVLYITTGKFKGLVCHTVEASDYTIIYQGTDGKEAQVIRIRHSDDEDFDREEVQAISHYLTDGVSSGTLLIGLTVSDCKTLN
ncbi:MAG: hypothetical protein V4538_15185 [Bacteroidota bacterium]